MFLFLCIRRFVIYHKSNLCFFFFSFDRLQYTIKVRRQLVVFAFQPIHMVISLVTMGNLESVEIALDIVVVEVEVC